MRLPIVGVLAQLLFLTLALSGTSLFYGVGGAHALTLQTRTFQMSGTDAKERLTVKCPGKKKLPYSGGMVTDPLGPNGEGIYPHSYERLGVQRGWHVTPVFYAPTAGAATRSVTLQVVCGPRLGPVSSPHATVFVGPGQSRTAVATCPRGNRLFAGGFQRTNFVTRGGNYVTESRAISNRSWQVSGGAFGNFGGELTAIAYCLRARGPLVTEVSAEALMPGLTSATVTTPFCPPRSTAVSGGFATSPAGAALVSSGHFNGDGSWSSTAFNRAGPDGTLSAHAYCMSAKTIKRRRTMRHGTRASHEKSIVAPPVLDRALKVAISERISNHGCYPGPSTLAGILRRKGISAQDVPGSGAVVRPGVVYVLADAATCERVRLAVRKSGDVIVLDSATGEVKKLKR
jgi:hypothetical protein